MALGKPLERAFVPLPYSLDLKRQFYGNFDKDPFDRLLIATAVLENLTLISIDDNIQKYDVDWVW